MIYPVKEGGKRAKTGESEREREREKERERERWKRPEWEEFKEIIAHSPQFVHMMYAPFVY